MAGINKGDILRATHGIIDKKPVTYITVKDKVVKEKLEKLPDVITTGEDQNGDLWVAIPKEVSLKDFVSKVVASLRYKNKLVRALSSIVYQ
jgi:hypothetical protein